MDSEDSKLILARLFRNYNKLPRNTKENEMVKDVPNFKDFVKEVQDLLEGGAEKKGYNNTGVDGENDLYQFIQNLSRSDAHAIGEIIYKAVRYTNKKDKRDLTKIAAWAFLVYRYGK
jgi:hypothetical protein